VKKKKKESEKKPLSNRRLSSPSISKNLEKQKSENIKEIGYRYYPSHTYTYSYPFHPYIYGNPQYVKATTLQNLNTQEKKKYKYIYKKNVFISSHLLFFFFYFFFFFVLQT